MAEVHLHCGESRLLSVTTGPSVWSKGILTCGGLELCNGKTGLRENAVIVDSKQVSTEALYL